MINGLSKFGFRMPAEWEKQDSIWITWPYNKRDWPGLFEYIPQTVAKIIAPISEKQKVNLIIKIDEEVLKLKKYLESFSANIKNIKFFKIPSNRIWIRDFGPIYLINKKTKKKVLINFKFNGWSKYKNFEKDNSVNNIISRVTKIKKIDPKIKIGNKKIRFILEGGAIDVNGKGSIMLTEECLLSKIQQCNIGVNREMYEKILSEYLNVKNYIWLKKGIKGDDTHGHIDDISRFVDSNTIMTAIENDKKDVNHNILKQNFNILKKAKNLNGKNFNIIKIPMPRPIFIEKVRVPASYLNFLICNKIILLPLFNDANDDKVISIFKKFFKTRKIIGIDCRKLIWGFGAIHCMTQQEPNV